MDSFGRYKIEKQIGIGGTAAVYLATHTGLGRKVVLKVMSNQLFAQDIDYKQLFIEEAQTIAHLHHPNIIQVYDVSTDEGRIYIEMEYLSGGTLKDRIQDNLPFDPIKIITEIAAALQYVFNASGTIHRDIKPSNILFREDENGLSAVLTDFGIAKTHDEDSEFTNIGVRVGTPRYMSPEQLMGGQIDQRSDLYSLGIIFYELLSGQLYNKEQSAGVIESFKTPQLPSDHKKLQPILNKLVTPNPKDRFNNANELINALARFKNYAPSSSTSKLRKNSTSNSNIPFNKVIIGTSALLGVLVLGGGGYFFYNQQQTNTQKKVDIELIETALLSLRQNETDSDAVFSLIKTASKKYPKEEVFEKFNEKAKDIARKQRLRSIIDSTTSLLENNEFNLVERRLAKAMNLSPSEIEEDEINQILSFTQEKRAEESNNRVEEDKRKMKADRINNLGTMIISGYGYEAEAPILSKIKDIKKVSSWPRVRVSNNKPLFIQCLYESPNHEIFRLHPYPQPKSTYSLSPQQPGTLIDIPLGEEVAGTSTITCIGSKKSLGSEFMSLFDTQYKLNRLTSIKEVIKHLKEETDGITLIESTEVVFK
ncbi:MAG: serine/threonine protein kinase [Cocleimonas sp.]|nr:serine/threonine protein kinase [Cocleimonas sp.]